MTLRLRFWTAVAAALVIALLSAAHPYVGGHGYTDMWVWRLKLAQLVLAALALLGCGIPVLAESARRLRLRRIDAVTLLSLASIGAFVYGWLAVFAPALFPSGMRSGTGVSPHFEASVAALAAALWRVQRT